MPRFRLRTILPALLAVVALVTLAGCGSDNSTTTPTYGSKTTADAPDANSVLPRARIIDMADRVAKPWVAHQDGHGLFYDKFAAYAAPGYGPVMVGYSLMRTGLRDHNQKLIDAGVRAADSEVRQYGPLTGVFERLAFAKSYTLARDHLPTNPYFAKRRKRWETYLKSLGKPHEGAQAINCIQSPTCFHNHEAVEIDSDLAMLDTGLVSKQPGALLSDRKKLRAEAMHELSVTIPEFTGRRAGSTGPGPKTGLGILSDSDARPLAYHELSIQAAAQPLLELGKKAPPATVAAVLRGVEAMAAFMAPDGDLSYIGRRQEQAWVMADAVYDGVVGARLTKDPAARARFLSMAARAMDNLDRFHPIDAWGMRIVPRPDQSPVNYERGIDLQNINYQGIVSYTLNLAADAAKGLPTDIKRVPITADDPNGGFVDPLDARFAATRHGDIWYAVHGRLRLPDARKDFGMTALKQKVDGKWVDIMSPRPLTQGGGRSGGPVIVVNGDRYFPSRGEVKLHKGGVITVRGGFEDRKYVDLGRQVVFTWTPTNSGVRMQFPALAGDVVRFTAFMPTASARATRTGARDAKAVYSTRPRPSSVRLAGGFSSCCELHMTAATMTVRVKRDGPVTYTVRARRH
jgi:hypothetical protein